jgi:inner membrane protease subunit 1
MLPTLNHMGDAVLVSPLPYWRPSWLAGGGRRPARGELVVYRKPTDPTCFVLKRVVAVEGDVVEVDPRRDSPPWDYWGAATKDGSDNPGADKWGQGKYIRVPKGHVWTAGDNLTNSTDSRDYGPVPVACIKGMVVARVSRWCSGSGLDSDLEETYKTRDRMDD